MIELAI